jgi:hypothetical protein
MSTDDRKQTNEPMNQNEQLPVEDLKAQPVDEEKAQDVKGGGFTISKPVDSSSPNIYKG